MGCSHSLPANPMLRLSGIESSITEILIAKRPGGADVGPVLKTPQKTRFQPRFNNSNAAASKTTKLPTGVLVFSVVKVVGDEDGVMFYHCSGTSAQEPTNEVRIVKRYSDFKALHSEIPELMANERNVPEAQQYLFETHPALPELPPANAWTYLRGRSNESVLEEREE